MTYSEFEKEFESAFPNVLAEAEAELKRQGDPRQPFQIFSAVLDMGIIDFFLNAFFVWSRSAKGHRYWSDINAKYQAYAREKYPHLIKGGVYVKV